ncbi:MAG: hypothetical protein K6E86_02760 [Bacteroidales bacterium]|nr:hypothetical protein [Bacteroidales bacterium]
MKARCMTLLMALAAVMCDAHVSRFEVTSGHNLDENEGTVWFEWVATNRTNNYRYRLYSYHKNGGRGFDDLQVALDLNPIDATKEAQVTAEDLKDENCWVQLFERETRAMMGEAMSVMDHLRRLTVNDVKMVEGLFANYTANDRIILVARGDYVVPTNCFGKALSALDEIICMVGGTLTLEGDIFGKQSGRAFPIYTFRSEVAQAWLEYMNAYGQPCRIYRNEAEVTDTQVLSLSMVGKR